MSLVHFATLDHRIENVVSILVLLWAVKGAFFGKKKKKKGKQDLKLDRFCWPCTINQS